MIHDEKPSLLLVLAVAALALTGCATAAPAASTSDLSLVETKSPVQLLRNEAASRVPTIAVKDVAELADSSVECDSTGVVRSWVSTATFLVNNSRAATIPSVITNLATSFEEQGWTVETAGATTTVSSASSPAVISIEAVAKKSGSDAAILISTSGPCVTTDGADSDEVKELEGRS